MPLAVQSFRRESVEGGFVRPVHTLVRTQPSSSACSINMAKAAIIIAVVAFSAFVAEGQYYPYYDTTPDSPYPYTDDYVTDLPPIPHPKPSKHLVGTLYVCSNDNYTHKSCVNLEIKDYGCHDINEYASTNGKWNNQARSVDTHGQCVHLFEHSGCKGERITVGPSCYNVGCCPYANILSKCNFANKMTSFMHC